MCSSLHTGFFTGLREYSSVPNQQRALMSVFFQLMTKDAGIVCTTESKITTGCVESSEDTPWFNNWNDRPILEWEQMLRDAGFSTVVSTKVDEEHWWGDAYIIHAKQVQ